MADLKQIYLRYKEEHDLAIKKVVESGRYIQGDEVDMFASEMSEYLLGRKGSDIVCTCGNGSDALLITYKTLGIKEGDEVVMPSHNYVASAESAVRLGLTPVIADTDSRRDYIFSIRSDWDYLERITTRKTKAIVMVNMYGMPCDTDSLRNFCQEKKLFLIEDNSQGMGGYSEVSQRMTKMSLHGDISTTSFFPTKPLGCMGDGGAIISENKDWVSTARQLSQHGQKTKYSYKSIGLNSRLDALQAAILRVRLSHLDEIIKSYNDIANIYNEIITSEYVQKPASTAYSRATFYQYTVILDKKTDRSKLMANLSERGLKTAVYYPEPLSDIGCYKKLSVVRCGLENINNIKNRMLSLPIYPFMPEEEAEKNANIFMETLNSF